LIKTNVLLWEKLKKKKRKFCCIIQFKYFGRTKSP
jgi:hypothetical protein